VHVFVTGGSGFIGQALVTRLATEHRVTALARSPEAADIVQRCGGTPVEADLDAIRPDHLQEAEVVVHCAALVSDWAPAGEFERVNVEGTRSMLSVARATGVRRFVHMSSDSVLFDGSDLVDVDEDTPYPDSTAYPYAVSKRRAEQIVRAANGPEFDTVCIRPVLVWGRTTHRSFPNSSKWSTAGPSCGSIEEPTASRRRMSTTSFRGRCVPSSMDSPALCTF
jgi:nucleoside-diphosphate-sugar epimerase